MLKFTREAFVRKQGQTNRELLAEMVSLTGLKNLDCHNLDLVSRRSADANKKVRVTILVENVED